ncbi:hypothetical protein ACRE_049150 [Hapsidospora chrysogenum ATCC 11550]|uniref:Cerato-platanin n=1 Tax=Hapsidospora chrysogenum (strain ATCC 11550 / CBS 779.69 / DSM 880 / IAM 14645 / JCM 23072 / IMI 49137) TaxID=857340 RepID=A0A086T4L0_HAPC1|nr:hypothetical protein ACRE_049150 [Hapsidospora chrysogenum ATCC 11550]
MSPASISARFPYAAVLLLILTSIPLAAAAAAAAAKKEDNGDGKPKDSGTVWATPHDSYSSSIGVLGCKIDTDHVAYWPDAVDCDNICVSLSYAGRTVKLLRIDQSQGAHDVSYEAWNYLYTGYSATDRPTAGGAVEMEFENLEPSKCTHLINTDGGKLPLSAANSMNYLASCLGQEGGTWVGDNFLLFNVADSICSIGHDEECDLDWPDANQASCPHTLGDNARLEGAPVYNILYPSGERVLASTGEVVEDDAASPSGLGAAVLVSVLFASCAVVVPWVI